MLIRVTSNYFCVGVVVGKIAAPIIKYMKNWSKERIIAYCKKRGWKYEIV